MVGWCYRFINVCHNFLRKEVYNRDISFLSSGNIGEEIVAQRRHRKLRGDSIWFKCILGRGLELELVQVIVEKDKVKYN